MQRAQCGECYKQQQEEREFVSKEGEEQAREEEEGGEEEGEGGLRLYNGSTIHLLNVLFIGFSR